MRNMAVLHSPAFSYPLPVLVRVLFNLLIFKGKILYYNKYSESAISFLIRLHLIYSYNLNLPPFLKSSEAFWKPCFNLT